MTFEEYWNSLSQDGKNKLADCTGINRQYLYQLGSGRRKMGVATMLLIKAKLPHFTDAELRPDLFGELNNEG